MVPRHQGLRKDPASGNALFNMRNVTLSIFALTLVLTSLPAQAEHRVALLIDNSDYEDESLKSPRRDLKALADRLGQFGFRCETHENLDESKLKSTIENFADRTPTLGTALVFFTGQVLPGKYKNNSGVAMLGVNSKPGRGYTVELALEALSQRGGSVLNLIVVDGPKAPTTEIKLPNDCVYVVAPYDTLLGNFKTAPHLAGTLRKSAKTFVSTAQAEDVVAGRGSVAIAPPSQFVLGRKAGDEWVNSRGMVFVWCPPGRYTKGSPANEPGRFEDEVQEQVVIETGFWIAKYEMTLRENLRNRPRNTLAKNKNDPLTMINHDDARAMTQRTFSASERKAGRLADDWQYSLPTEDQWEYAARAGTSSPYYFGTDINDLPKHANFGDKSHYETGDVFSLHSHRTLDDGAVLPTLVGSYLPNAWGLHDIHGNVAEWCINGAIRGGNWVSTPETCRVAYRHHYSSRNEQNFIGYRIVIQKTPPAKPKK